MPSEAAATEDEGLMCREVNDKYMKKVGYSISNEEDAVEGLKPSRDANISKFSVLDLYLTICSLDCKSE